MNILDPTNPTAFENQCFAAWMNKVDGHLDQMVGVDSSSLCDAPWRDWHDDGFAPIEAARLGIQYAGGQL